MRLLLVSHSSNVGGTEVCFGRALAFLAQRNDVEVVAAYPEGQFAEEWGRLVQHVPYAGSLPPWPRARGYVGWALRALTGTRALKARLAEEDFDAVVVFTSVATGAVAAANAAGVPCVCYVREFVHPDSLQSRLWRFLGRRCDRLIAVSSAIAEELEPYAPGRVDLVRDGVPLPEQAAGRPPATDSVGCYAGYDRAKGGETFVRAAAILAAERPGLVFNYYGVAQPAQTSERDRLHRLAEELGVLGSVRFHEITGFAPTYADNTVVTVPSHSEGLGLVALEAMAAGVPVVASATGGLLDVVKPPAGRLVAPGDAEALAREVSALLGDPDRLAAEGAAGRARVAEEFSIELAMSGLVNSAGRVVRRAEGRAHASE